jgi:hypothetical protein
VFGGCLFLSLVQVRVLVSAARGSIGQPPYGLDEISSRALLINRCVITMIHWYPQLNKNKKPNTNMAWNTVHTSMCWSSKHKTFGERDHSFIVMLVLFKHSFNLNAPWAFFAPWAFLCGCGFRLAVRANRAICLSVCLRVCNHLLSRHFSPWAVGSRLINNRQ